MYMYMYMYMYVQLKRESLEIYKLYWKVGGGGGRSNELLR